MINTDDFDWLGMRDLEGPKLKAEMQDNTFVIYNPDNYKEFVASDRVENTGDWV